MWFVILWRTVFEFQLVSSSPFQYPWVVCDLLLIVCVMLQISSYWELLLGLFLGVNCGFVAAFRFLQGLYPPFPLPLGFCRFLLYGTYLGLRLDPLPYLEPVASFQKNGFVISFFLSWEMNFLLTLVCP